MKKLNNKGFSLVELIIVIAIMAILIGVVGTQVIPYLENSRKAKDLQVFSAWNTAAVSAYSTEAGNLSSTATYTIGITAGGTGITATANPTTATGASSLLTTFKSLAGIADSFAYANDMDSKAGKDVSMVTITINGNNGDVTTTITNATPADYSFDAIENK